MPQGPLCTPDVRVHRMSPKGRAWLVALEGGMILEAYQERGDVPTIGPGLTTLLVEGVYRRVTLADRFETEQAAMEQFGLQLGRYEALVDAATRDDITQVEFDAFASLCFNVEAAFRSSTQLVRSFNFRAPMPKIAAELRRWCRQGSKVHPGLVERRACESDLLLHGVYRTQGQKLPVGVAA